MIKVIFFDAAGTLFRVKGSVGEVYLRYAKKYGVPFSPEQVQAVNFAFKQVFREAPPPIFAVSQPRKLKQCERLWWFDIVHAVFYRVGMFEGFDEYFDDVYEAFGTPEPWEVFSDVPQVLRDLRHAGYELGVVSNFDTRFYGIMRGLELSPYFDSITLSSLASAAKPSPRIFQYALEQHAVDPEEALHVGDNLEEDVLGAQNARLAAVWVNRNNEPLKNNLTKIEFHTIPSLKELPAFLSKL